VLPRIDAGIVAIAPLQLQGIGADGGGTMEQILQRRGLTFGSGRVVVQEHGLAPAACARTCVTERSERHRSLMAVGPREMNEVLARALEALKVHVVLDQALGDACSVRLPFCMIGSRLPSA